MKTIKKYKDFVLENISTKQFNLPKDIEEISKIFTEAGKDLFVVGGACRDFLQGKIPHDYDLVTNALPEESKKILKGWNVSDEQGKNFGVLRIFTKDEPLGYELATYRKDISKGRDTKGDEQKVEIGKHITIEDDVLRRDLTCNAIFYDINKKQIVDLVGGYEDIQNNIIRAVGDPKKRFNEDRLRILRCFRFAARTGGKIDERTSNAIKEDNRLMGIGPKDDVSDERILGEWNKMREHAENNIKLMQDYIDLLFEYNMFEQMFPVLNYSDVIVTSLENSILFYDLFWDNENEEITKAFVKTPTLSSLIIFFREIEYKWDNIDNVYKLALYYKKMNMTRELFLDFVDHIQQGGYYTYYKIEPEWAIAFCNYCDDGFVNNGLELKAKGFQGNEIYQEKQRLEIERFKNEYLS